MQLRVLGCAGAESPGHNTSAFLVDDTLLLDAGTVCAVLGDAEQTSIRQILLTHAHFDHIKGLPLLADSLFVAGCRQGIEVYGRQEVLAALRAHILNGVIWPDFTTLPAVEAPLLRFVPLTFGTDAAFDDFRITMWHVPHSVPAAGFIVRKGGRTLLYTGDCGPEADLWQKAGSVDAAIVEISFPDSMAELALRTGHLTPRLLATEVLRLPYPPRRLLVTHQKPPYGPLIRAELASLGLRGVEFLEDGASYAI